MTKTTYTTKDIKVTHYEDRLFAGDGRCILVWDSATDEEREIVMAALNGTKMNRKTIKKTKAKKTGGS